LPSAPPLNPQSATRHPQSLCACLYRPPAPEGHDGNRGAREERREDNLSASSAISAVPSLIAIAQEFSPRYERHRDDLVSVDVSEPRACSAGADDRRVRRELPRGRAHVAVAGTHGRALLARARPRLTVIEPGEEAETLAALAIGILERVADAVGAGLLRRDCRGRKPTKVGPTLRSQRSKSGG
jgi:hypothetical protein